MLTPLERHQLLRRWEWADAELRKLDDLPAGSPETADRERRLLDLQSRIEAIFVEHFRAAEAAKPGTASDPARSTTP